jgi:hypothetical protein
MCMSSPSYTPPAPAQDAKQPEVAAGGAKKRSSSPGAMAASTLLTGPSGIDNSQLKLGKSSLLGS